ncbi:MAG TPA: hypothetical protein VIH42_10500 [Thermoguttaceae bacterium]
MSLPSSTKKTDGTFRKLQPDLYTLLLALALLAILIAIVFLYLHMQTYNFEIKSKTPIAAITTQLRVLVSSLWI